MIKYLGSVGGFIRLNDNQDNNYNFLNIFSSSATSELLFSASLNNSTGVIQYNSASTVLYVNGLQNGTIYSKEWSHFTLSFNEKLQTNGSNNFIIRFGDFENSNFNLQNLYILESSFINEEEVSYLHKEFTGLGNDIIRVNDSASYSINIIDAPEKNFISASVNVIYQPLFGQKNYISDIAALTGGSLVKFVSASVMTNDDLYIDSFNIEPGNKVLSIEDNQIYELTASSTLTSISSSDGDFVKVLYGRYFGNTFYLKTTGSFQLTPFIAKINSYVNRIV